ncbi:unnamed protein product [Mucor hiemalis]
MKEIFRSIKAENRYAKKESAIHVEDIQQERAVRNSFEDIFGTETSIHESMNHRYQYRRRSSAFKRDLFGGYTVPLCNQRRSSYELDENDLANCLKEGRNSLEEPNEPPLHSHTTKNIHPLATDSPDLSNLTSTDSFFSNHDNVSRIEESRLNIENGGEESEDMFALDEEIEEVDNGLFTTYDRRLSSRRSSAKYIEDDSSLDNAETVCPVQSENTNLATSFPLSITPAYADSKMHPVNVLYHPSNPTVEPTTKKEYRTTNRASFVGFDSAEADRKTSLQLPPIDDNPRYRRKSSSAIALLKNKKGTVYESEQARRNTMMNLNFFNEEEDDGDGPMIPPHIFAANMITDETEGLFGSLPQKNMRQRLLG